MMNAPVTTTLAQEANAAILRSKYHREQANLFVARREREIQEQNCEFFLRQINAIKREAYGLGIDLNPPRKEL
jgi:hypothetical protein